MADQGNGGTPPQAQTPQTPGAPKVEWDDHEMKSVYANVVNVSSTREEVSLFFGTNQSWNPQGGEVKVQLTDRVILNPFAAKRLFLLLGNLLKQYEERFGALQVEARERPEQM